MYEVLITALAGLVVTGLGWLVTKIELRTKNKIILALVGAIEKLDEQEVKELVDQLATRTGVKEKLDKILANLGWLRKSAPVLLLVTLLALGGCQALGQTPTATGATGVGQYGALSGLQAGSTQLSMSGSVSVQVQPVAGGALMPDAVKALVAKIAAETDAMLADPNLTPEAKKEILERGVQMLTQLSAPWGVIHVTLTDLETGDAEVTGETGKGSGGGPAAMCEPEKPEGPNRRKPTPRRPRSLRRRLPSPPRSRPTWRLSRSPRRTSRLSNP